MTIPAGPGSESAVAHAVTQIAQILAYHHRCGTPSRAACDQCRRSAEVAVTNAARHAKPATRGKR